MINRAEFEKLILDDESLCSLEKLSAENLTKLLGADFGAMKYYNQNNPHHCHNLLKHTIEVARNIPAEELSAADCIILRAAAMFHDIAKPETAQEKNGHLVFYGHAKVSAEKAEKILYDIGYNDSEVKRLCFFIGHHDDFISFKESNHARNPYIKIICPASVHELMKDTRARALKNNDFVPRLDDYLLLLRLCRADAMAQAPVVMRDGQVIDSTASKLSRLEAIEAVLKV